MARVRSGAVMDGGILAVTWISRDGIPVALSRSPQLLRADSVLDVTWHTPELTVAPGAYFLNIQVVDPFLPDVLQEGAWLSVDVDGEPLPQGALTAPPARWSARRTRGSPRASAAAPEIPSGM